MNVIASMNALNTPWIAILVIVIGMIFDVCCKIYGLNSDAASAVIGAGVGLLTGQALAHPTQPAGVPDPTQK